MPSWSQKIEARNFPEEFVLGIFLGLSVPLCRHSIYCCFVSGSWWYDQVSSMVTNRDRKSFGSRRKNSKNCSDDWHRWRFWSAFMHFGTHFAESFGMSIFSWMMCKSLIFLNLLIVSHTHTHTHTHARAHTRTRTHSANDNRRKWADALHNSP